ncbi:hypothetical protein JMJ77_0013420 [Colletotrichum scovillei]|uniref:Uncharacterized protein n=1 Tax=Colletotrichum scovillei TaxID=1209932 RepID=A0A9P7R7A8_9PEZI|nr:hypothetical protein JMJ77_0013420 [Colletotrichum scovillei]KAG7069723.1 hypothetical protein JMJ76_0003386 [Colletotrichum scovillei]KAG7073670.1 hypothetical protein JMJ78_0014640 [Colletotrichum scovillei]
MKPRCIFRERSESYPHQKNKLISKAR